MKGDIGNYAEHARFWDWGGQDRTDEHEYWLSYAAKYGRNVLIPMCALGEAGAYMAGRGMNVTAFDITPEMIEEGRRRFGGVKNLNLLYGDVRDFSFDIPPADFCYSDDFGHLSTLEDIKRALGCINRHLREGGGMVIETGLRVAGGGSSYHPSETFYPLRQVYPDLTVWKTGDTRNDGESGRCYISQVFYARHADGRLKSFEHSFYLQGYFREEWLSAFSECGFEVADEYAARDHESWQSGSSGYRIFEAVKVREHMTPTEVGLCAPLIARIDSAEGDIFRETVNTESQITTKVFYDGGVAGVFHSCMLFGGLRMSIAFEHDTDAFNEQLAACARNALKRAGAAECPIWLRAENARIIEFLKGEFDVEPTGKHYYSSVEYIMRRGCFKKAAGRFNLKIRPYEEARIDEYLNLLDAAMTFADPPADFMGNKNKYLVTLAERALNNSFEAFWMDDTLVGLYWRENFEINTLAVAPAYQRRGCGAMILTRAIDVIFSSTDAEYARLYAVNWNDAGQSFYKKYGMEQNGHSYLLRLKDYYRGGGDS